MSQEHNILERLLGEMPRPGETPQQYRKRTDSYKDD